MRLTSSRRRPRFHTSGHLLGLLLRFTDLGLLPAGLEPATPPPSGLQGNKKRAEAARSAVWNAAEGPVYTDAPTAAFNGCIASPLRSRSLPGDARGLVVRVAVCGVARVRGARPCHASLVRMRPCAMCCLVRVRPLRPEETRSEKKMR